MSSLSLPQFALPVFAVPEAVQNVATGGARDTARGERAHGEAGAPEWGHAIAHLSGGTRRLWQWRRTDAGYSVAGVHGVCEAAQLLVVPGELPGPVGPGGHPGGQGRSHG